MSDPTSSPSTPTAQAEGNRNPTAGLRWNRSGWIQYNLVPVASLLVVMVMLSAGLIYTHDQAPSGSQGTANMHVDVQASEYSWTFVYTDPFGSTLTNGTGATSAGTLWLPLNAVVEFNVTTKDVNHGFGIADLGVDVSATPGQVNHYTLRLPSGTVVGERFLIQCTVPCGPGHMDMKAWLVVTPANSHLGTA